MIARQKSQRSDQPHSRFLLMIFMDRKLQRLDGEACDFGHPSYIRAPMPIAAALNESVQRSHRYGILIFLIVEQCKDEQPTIPKAPRRGIERRSQIPEMNERRRAGNGVETCRMIVQKGDQIPLVKA